MKNRTTALLSLLLAALFALAVFFACNNTTNDATPAPSEAVITEDPADVPITDVPTAVPTEPTEVPSEAEIIEEAWKFASRIGELHNLKLKKELAECYTFSNSGSIRFYDEPEGRELSIGFELAENGNVKIEVNQITAFMSEKSDEKYTAWYTDPIWNELTSKYRDAKITVTAEEIRKAGCTETEGEEYVKTVAGLYAEKIAEMFRSLPEDSPIHCYEVKITDCECENEEEGSFTLNFSARVADLAGMSKYFDTCVVFNDGKDDPELLCWLDFGGELMLTKSADGSWSGNACFNNPGD